MIRILYYGLSWFQGGIECYLYKICKNLNRENFEIAFIDEMGGKAVFRNELEKMGAVFYDITPRRISIVRNRKELMKLFLTEHFDILHFNCNTLSYITPMSIARKHGVKVLLHSRNSKCSINFITNCLHYLNKTMLYSWDIFRLAVSDSAGKWLFGKASYNILNNGVEVQRFAFDENKRKILRRQLGLDQKTVFCNVGVFFEVKNHIFLLEIFNHIYQRNKNIALLIAGDGPLRPNIENHIQKLGLSDLVYLLGKRDDVENVLMASDCMIFPSLYEGFPNAVLEAETAGLPVLMSDVITKEVCLVEQCMVKSLSEGAANWAQEAEQLAESQWNRKEGAEIITQKGYSTESEIKKVEEIYYKLVN